MADIDLRYSIGTVTVAADGSVVNGTGVLWEGVNVRQWDAIQIDPANNNILVPILSVVTNAQLSIPEWNGGAKTNVPYVIYKISPLRYSGGKSMADVDDMLAKLNTEGWYRYINPIYADPTAAGIVANEGQFAFKYTTGQLWIMSGGVWQFVGIFKGFSAKGAWSNATAYNVNDVVSYNGGSYIALQAGTNHLPTDTAWWMVLAAKGDIGPATLKPLVAWATATAYAPGPPADYVTINGSSYACTVAHTSAAAFATDLAAGRWISVAVKGADAPIYGGVSTTSLAIGTGSKAFTTQANLAYQNGSRVRASSAANTSNWMEGVATYSGTTLTINVDKINGSGTLADWNFNVAGQPGAGDLSSANNLSDLNNFATARQNLQVVAARQLLSTGNANSLVEDGNYSIATPVINMPINSLNWILSVARLSTSSVYVIQTARQIATSDVNVYERRNDNGTWTAWKKVGYEYPNGEWVYNTPGTTPTFTTPADSTTETIYEYEMLAPGGGGGAADGGSASAGAGGAGAEAGGTFTGIAPSTSVPLTLGIIGVGVGPGNGKGGDGGVAAIGSPVSVSCSGGIGGNSSSSGPAIGGLGGGTVTGSPNRYARAGQRGSPGIANSSGAQGGGGDGASSSKGSGGIGGRAGLSANALSAGTGYGAGGGGAFNVTATGSNGSGPYIRIRRIWK